MARNRGAPKTAIRASVDRVVGEDGSILRAIIGALFMVIGSVPEPATESNGVKVPIDGE
jgi:hypothetical protein